MENLHIQPDARRFAMVILLVVTATLVLFYYLMNPPINEIGLMAVYLSITALLSIGIGYLAYRLGWLERSPNIAWTIFGGYILSSGITFFNVWLTAYLMFVNQHDLLLATVLLVFASGVAVAYGYFFAGSFTRRLRELESATRRYAEGKFEHRVSISGSDEVVRLAGTMNLMAQQLAEAEQKKQELDQLRRDLVAWTSHDLQTPLASLRAIVEALADNMIEDPETEKRYLMAAQRDIRSLSALIDDLFQLAQIDAGGLQIDPALNSLGDLISDTLETFNELAGQKEIVLRGQVDPHIDPVWMDVLQIGRVLNNLISNAIRYSQPGGEVTVSARREQKDILVEVSDTGPGIPQQDQGRVFERFFRGEKSRNRASGGAGLGLAIARGIIQAHGGEIGLESMPGKKTIFWFRLPTTGLQ
jgi:signal transduction histidine kinase